MVAAVLARVKACAARHWRGCRPKLHADVDVMKISYLMMLRGQLTCGCEFDSCCSKRWTFASIRQRRSLEATPRVSPTGLHCDDAVSSKQCVHGCTFNSMQCRQI